MNRIAIIDDDEEIVKLFGRVAEGSGFDSYATTNPHAFLDYAKENKPTHILLDLQMPELDGVEILRHLAAMKSEAKIFFVSGFDPKVLDVASKLGREQGLNIVEKVSKPVSAKALKELLIRHKSADQFSKERLLEGLKTGQFFLVFQPKFDVHAQKVTSCEALMRWQHPELGLVAPDQFISLMEEHEMVRDLSGFVVTEACKAIHAFTDAGNEEIKIAVNISAGDLNDVSLASRLREICQAQQVSPERLILELTESVAMANPVAAMDNLARVRLHGFGLSLDDFGTGFSSLAVLRDMPFSEIKIDKSFVDELKDTEGNQEIIRAVVSIGRAFDMRVVAEGCEDEHSYQLLQELGCDMIQGYYIARPMPLEEALRFQPPSQGG